MRTTFCLFAALLTALSCAATAQQTTLSTTGTGPRPVRDVILQWEKQYGWVITYEDPRLVYSGDIEDVTLKVRRDLKPGEAIDPSKRIIGARERQIAVSYSAPKTSADTAAEFDAVKQLIDASAKEDGNTFSVSQSEGRIHVLPGMIKDVEGQPRPSQPLLDTAISLSAADRSGSQFIRDLCDALTTATGYKVHVDMHPSNDMVHFHAKVAYENRPATQILEDFFNSMPDGKRYTWALLFQKEYALNIHWVKDINRSDETAPAKPAMTRPTNMRERHNPDGTTVFVQR